MASTTESNVVIKTALALTFVGAMAGVGWGSFLYLRMMYRWLEEGWNNQYQDGLKEGLNGVADISQQSFSSFFFMAMMLAFMAVMFAVLAFGVFMLFAALASPSDEQEQDDDKSEDSAVQTPIRKDVDGAIWVKLPTGSYIDEDDSWPPVRKHPSAGLNQD